MVKKAKKDRKKRRKIVGIVMLIILSVSVFGMIISIEIGKPSNYSEEQHIQRVTERIQAKYIDGDYLLRPYDKPANGVYPKVKATDFEVFPLYNESDELKYFLVEFQPFGYVYVHISEWNTNLFECVSSMYSLSSREGDNRWTPCTIDRRNGNDLVWETDEKGEKIVYYNSPFAVRNIENERRYLIRCKEKDSTSGSGSLIPSIKRDGKFINLYSNSEYELVDGFVTEKQVDPGYIHFINSNYFNLR